MKFKNYCLVVLGRVDGVKDEISKISETAVRYVDAKGIVIATFSTVATALELREFFTLNNRSFVLFEMGDDNYGVNLTNKAIHDHLFAEIEQYGSEILNSMSNKLMNDIKGSMGTKSITEATITGSSENVITSHKKNEFDGIDFTNLSVSEREKIVNKILDKGFEKMDDQDRNILKKLTKPGKK